MRIRSISLGKWLPIFITVLFVGVSLGLSFSARYELGVNVENSSLKFVRQDLISLQYTLDREFKSGDSEHAWQTLLQRSLIENYAILMLVDSEGEILYSKNFEERGRRAGNIFNDFDHSRFVNIQENKVIDVRVNSERDAVEAYIPVEMGRIKGEIRGLKVGAIVARYDLQMDKNSIWKRWKLYISFILGNMFLALLLLLGFLFAFVIDPMQKLRVKMTKLHNEEAYEADPFGKGEIAEFDLAFSKVSSNLQKRFNELHEAENELRESEVRYRSLVEGAPVCIHEIDMNGRLIAMNRVGLIMSGVETEEEIKGMDYLQLVSGQDKNHVGEMLELAMEGKVAEFEFKSSDKCRYYKSSAAPINNANGSVKRIMGVSLDITKEVKVQRDLRESNWNFRTLVESLSQIYWVIVNDSKQSDGGYRLLYLSPSIYKVLGVEAEEVFSSPLGWYEMMHVDDVSAFRESMHDCLERGIDMDVELRVFHKNGQEKNIHFSGSRFSDRGDGLNYAAGMARDVTDFRSVEKDLRIARKMDALGQLAGGIAHDFNNLLCVISGETELIELQEELSLKAKKRLDSIKRAGVRGANLIKQLQGFSRSIDDSSTTIINANANIVKMQGMFVSLIPANIKVVFELEKDLWDVSFNSSDFDDAMLNLLINARDAIEREGVITVTTGNRQLDQKYCDAHDSLTPGEYVFIEIRDTGIGIEPFVMDKIFDPFFTTKSVGKGSGLGLSMVFGFVKRSGGYINATSVVGVGSVFSLFFPRAQFGQESSENAISVSGFSNGNGELVLLVDDDSGIVDTSKGLIESLGYRVLAVSQGSDAIGALKTNKNIQLVISDIVMPSMNGYQLAEWVAKNRPEVKVILASGYANEKLDGAGEGVYSAEILEKPYSRDDLATRLWMEIGSARVASHNVSKAKRAFLWSENMGTGVAPMDSDHKWLIEAIAHCHELVELGDEVQAKILLDQLSKYAQAHLEREESLMEAVGYPWFDNHRSVHQLYIKKVNQMHVKLDQGQLLNTDMVDFLWDWWTEHIQTLDLAYVEYCEGKEVLIDNALKTTEFDSLQEEQE